MVVRDNKCVRDGGWTEFDSWTPCAQAAGAESGTSTRKRSCSYPAPLNSGKNCADLDGGAPSQSRVCRHGGWGSWGSDRNRNGGCSKTCGGGTQTRRCTFPRPLHGNTCAGPSERPCNTFECVPTEPCKHMTCTHREGLIQVHHHHKEHRIGHLHHHCMWHHGIGCQCLCNKVHGVPAEHKDIVTARAAMPTHKVFMKAQLLVAAASVEAIDGGWSKWSQWSACHLTTNTKIRVRSCSEPWPQGLGKQCEGSAWENNAC
jgi:hypothetical protein